MSAEAHSVEAAGGHPTVSVIVAAYNVAQYVSPCIDSLLSNEGCAIEVIVVDDGSSDGTGDTVHERFAGDPRVQLLRLGENRGPSHARNVAIERATGEWLALVDADDWCKTDRFATLIATAHRFRADMVSDDQYLVEDGSREPWATINQVSRWTQDPSTPVAFERFLASRHIVKPLIRREFVKKHGITFCEEIRHSEDFLFVSELLIAGAKWHMIPAAMYYYRLRRGSLTNTGEFADGNARALQRLCALERIAKDPGYAELCSRTLRKAGRDAKVRDIRRALRRRDIAAVCRLLAGDTTLLWSMLWQEVSLVPLRARRRVHRMRFG